MKRRGNRAQPISKTRWLAYATAGAATAIGTAPCLEAEIHYSGLINAHFDSTFHSKKFFPLAGRARLSFARSVTLGPFVWNYAAVSASISAGVRTAYVFPPRRAEKFTFGQTISQGRFSRYNGSARNNLCSGYPRNGDFGDFYGRFKDPGEGFVGFKFNVGNGTQYGWARVRIIRNRARTFILRDYAWADPGETITAGQTIPSPGGVATMPAACSLGLLALGSIGLVALRKHRGKDSLPGSDTAQLPSRF
jgi:hypothetical protein